MAGRNNHRKKVRKPTLAERADRYRLYQKSVQDPDHEVEFFDRVYRSHFKRPPVVLREDFCGTFAVCCAWAQKRGRKAIGVDIDPEPLDWGRAHNLAKLSDQARKRVKLVQADVRVVNRTKAHVLAAQNFSFWIFKTRPELLEYFKIAHANLFSRGVFVADMMGGGDCFVEKHKDVRKYGHFKYIWEQARIDPITHDSVFYIHFGFKDGSKLKRAFKYNWRFWSIPEVRELLVEAGFRNSFVYWEGTEKRTGQGDGVWRKSIRASNDPSWISYIVAVK